MEKIKNINIKKSFFKCSGDFRRANRKNHSYKIIQFYKWVEPFKKSRIF